MVFHLFPEAPYGAFFIFKVVYHMLYFNLTRYIRNCKPHDLLE